MLINENLQTICNQVLDLMPHLNDKFVADICNRLVTLGVVPDEDDVWLIYFTVQKVEADILNQTNQTEIPEGLFVVAVDMVCGEIIQTKYLSGKLCLSDLQFGEIAKTVTQGDTTVTFESGESDEVKIKRLIDCLIDKGSDLLCYRKLKW